MRNLDLCILMGYAHMLCTLFMQRHALTSISGMLDVERAVALNSAALWFRVALGHVAPNEPVQG